MRNTSCLDLDNCNYIKPIGFDFSKCLFIYLIINAFIVVTGAISLSVSCLCAHFELQTENNTLQIIKHKPKTTCAMNM